MLCSVSLRTLAGRVGEGSESGGGSSLELACGGMTEGGGGTEAAGLAEGGEETGLHAQPETAITRWGIVK